MRSVNIPASQCTPSCA